MAQLRWLADRFLRIDARSLGLFRILFGLVLIGDLKLRFDWITAFYSNDGVLPNHNHLFQLRDSAEVWSIYHAFSHRDETYVAFAFTLLFYLCFTLGWYTRVFTVLCAVCLVSLSGRNILLNGIGDSFAICLILLSMFLPLGARFSLDSLRRSFAEVDEHRPADLNDRTQPKPGEARASLAALALLFVVGFVPLAAALQQKGATWSSGTALHYALRSDRWVSGIGEALRHKASLGVTSAWTRIIQVCEFALLPLLLVPVARTVTRKVAMALVLVLGATFALCFSLGPYGWSLLAATALLVPTELWDRRKSKTRPIRLFYDEDCGICLWLARLLKRLDLRHNITFVGNSDWPASYRDGELPANLTADTANESMIAVDADDVAHTDAAALAQVLRSLPIVWPIGLAIRVPGLEHLVGWLYYRVAANRVALSAACGLGACGVSSDALLVEGGEDGEESSAKKWRRRVAMGIETALVALTIAMVMAASESANEIPRTGLGKRRELLTAASLARVTAPWGLWAPDPPLRNEVLVTLATARDAAEIDVLNGHPPDPDLAQPARHRLGVLWAQFGDNIRREEFASFRQEFRRYLMRGGPVADATDKPQGITQLKAYWISAPIAAPGKAAEGEPERIDIFETNLAPRPFQPDMSNLRGPKMRTPLQPMR